MNACSFTKKLIEILVTADLGHINSLHARKFLMFLFIFFLGFSSVSKKLDSDQTQHFVGPDLAPYCLHMNYQQKTLADKELTLL